MSSIKAGVFILGLAALVSLRSSGAAAQGPHVHKPARASQQRFEPDAKGSALIKIVREATERFQDVDVAKAEGYALQFGCVSGSESGAMGMHFVNGPLVGDGEIDPTRPEIVIYEPMPNGKLETDRRGLPGHGRRVECEARRPARVDGAAVPPVRGAEPIRAPHVLHAARVGLEGQPDRRVRELAPERVVQRVCGQVGA